MITSNETDVFDRFHNGVIGAFVTGTTLRAKFGDQPLQDLVDIDVTGSTFWEFFKEACNRDLNYIGLLSQEGILKSIAEAWKAEQH